MPAVLLILGLVFLCQVYGGAAELRGLVPNFYEDAAIGEGEKLGIGSAKLVGPESAEVLSHQTWKLVYTAGRAGVKPRGGIRIGMRHLSQWSLPQTKDPKAVGYFTAKAAGDQAVKITIDFRRRFFSQYFAWQHMLEVLLPERGLRPGETLELVYGDTSGGSLGMRVQPFDESCFVFKTYVDAQGYADFLPVRNSPSIEVVGAEPYRLNVVMPTNALTGQPSWCLVRAEDRYGNPAPRYRGTVRLTSTDAAAGLPQAY